MKIEKGREERPKEIVARSFFDGSEDPGLPHISFVFCRKTVWCEKGCGRLLRVFFSYGS